MAKPSKGRAISIRLSESILEALDARAVLDEKDRTQVIREAIMQYLDLPEDSLEEKLATLQEEYSSLKKDDSSLNRRISTIHQEVKSGVKRTDSLEVRLEELGKMMAIFLEKSR